MISNNNSKFLKINLKKLLNNQILILFQLKNNKANYVNNFPNKSKL